MKPRVMLFGVFLASLLTFSANTAFADPPPWAGRWKHDKHCREDGRRNSDYRPGRYSDYGPGRYRNDGARGSFDARIAHDQDLIRRWEGTGRHEKVVQWARQDIRNTQRNSYGDRYGDRYGVRYDPRDDPRYDPYPDRYDPYPNNARGYDPYYGGDSLGAYGSFDIKRDWPYLLGGMLGSYQGR